MTWAETKRELILGVHPTARGLGWVALEGPFSVVESGLFNASRDKNAACLKEVARVINRLSPAVLVLETFDKQSSQRSGRIRRLCLDIVGLAADRGLTVEAYRREQVRANFAVVGARTRDDIAEAVARMLPALRHRLPKKRGAGDSEDKRLSIFTAAALVLTYYQNGATALLDELRDAA